MCRNIPSETMFSYISKLMMTQKVDICLRYYVLNKFLLSSFRDINCNLMVSSS